MGPSGFASQISVVFGLVLFLLSVWFLHTIDIRGNPFNATENYAEYVAERRIRLEWGTAAGIGIIIGIFQFTFSSMLIFTNIKEQQIAQIWTLAAVILHILFLFGTSYILHIGITGLFKNVGVLQIVFVVTSIVETLFLVIYLVVFEREYGYFGTVFGFFTCDEVKLKLAEASLFKFPTPTSNIRMERLVEETSIPV